MEWHSVRKDAELWLKECKFTRQASTCGQIWLQVFCVFGKLGERYNIGGHNEKQNIQIIHIILDTLQEMLPDGDPRKELVSDKLITYVTGRKGHDRRYAIAPDKIKAEIGWYPETMFEEGIKKTIQWFFEHEDWMKHVTNGDYQKYYEEMYK